MFNTEIKSSEPLHINGSKAYIVMAFNFSYKVTDDIYFISREKVNYIETLLSGVIAQLSLKKIRENIFIPVTRDWYRLEISGLSASDQANVNRLLSVLQE